MKRFFGGVFIEKEKLEEAGINYPIKLEYYKQINEDYMKCDTQTKYGISIVKTEYIQDNLKIETKNIDNITNDEIQIDKLLNLFKENQVTSINSEEVITDLIRIGF